MRRSSLVASVMLTLFGMSVLRRSEGLLLVIEVGLAFRGGVARVGG